VRLAELTAIEHTLGCGLRVLVVPQPQVHRAVLHCQVRIGSRFEAAPDNGISHFLEHMLYRGTRELPSAHELSLAIERWGGSLDAATSADAGTLSLVAPPENLERLIPTFAEVFQRPLYHGIDVERGIVREEILESYDDTGNCVDADDLIRAHCFPGHPLGQPIAGTFKELEGFDQARLSAHHRRFYTGSNTVIAIAGRVDADRVLRGIEDCFKDLPQGLPVSSAAPTEQRGPRYQHARHSGSQTQLRVAFRAPGWDSADEPAMEVLARLLDDGMSTRLYHRICDELGLCYEVSGGYEVYSDAGLLELHAETSHDQAAAVLGEMLDLVRRLRDDGPAESELEAVLQRYRWHAEGLLDDPYAVADFAADAVQGGRSWSIDHRVQTIGSVTWEQVRNAAQRWWSSSGLSVVTVGSLNKSALRQCEQKVLSF
jgi:predicted Zn-dependent peptidase